MGNKLGRRKQVVDDKYTKPQGLYQHKDVDHKKLRKLILDSKLAPCYPGDDDTAFDLEECPICFLYYPSLNRSRCCMKGICTECFLQMKTPNSTRPTQCPFCKTSNYAVEYRGVKTKEEKGIEQIEEQRVIEAKIRIQQQELQDEKERMQQREEISSSSQIVRSGEVEYSTIAESSSVVEGGKIVSSQHSSAASSIRQPPRARQNREDEFDLDLEDVMVMEAIWLSIQEEGRHLFPAQGDAAGPLEQQYVSSEDRCVSAAMVPLAEISSTSSSPSGGLACAIAALAERQQIGGGGGDSSSSSNYNGNYNMMMPHGYSRFREEQLSVNYPPPPPPASGGGSMEGEWVGLEVAEAGTSYGGSDDAAGNNNNNNTALFPQEEDENDSGDGGGGGSSIVPESFEEQMMLAMAVSLAEARARTSAPGVAWQ